VNLLPGIFIAVVVPIMVRVDEPDLSLLKTTDWLGIALMAACLGCLEYTLEEGPRWNWTEDATIRTTAWISVLAGIGFIWRSLTYAHPIVDLTALKSRNFALGCLFSFVTGIGIFATIYLTPLFLGRVRGFSALQIGLAVFSTGVFQVMAIPVYAILAKRVDLRWLMMFGLGLFGLSMWNFTPITHDWGSGELLWPQAMRGFAQQFAVAPTVTLTLGGLAPNKLKLASGLFNLMRNLGGAIGIAACATILNDRTNLHFLRLAEHLNATNSAMLETIRATETRTTGIFSGDADHGHAAALRQLWSLAYREAQTMTYADAFVAITVCFALATALVPLMRKVGAPKGPSAEAH
jgi:DHA2 family multidrug resistance protein